MALSFIIIYGIFSIPDEILYLSRLFADTNTYGAVFLTPLLGLLKEFADTGKFAGLYAIPYVGTPFLESYHFGLEMASSLVVDGVNLVKNYNCADEMSMKRLGIYLLNWQRMPMIADNVRSYNLQHTIEVLAIQLIPELKKCYQERYETLPFWQKISDEYLVSKYAFNGFCTALDLVSAVAGVINSMGGSEQIANYMKTGNVAGVISLFLAPIIALIMWLAGWLG